MHFLGVNLNLLPSPHKYRDERHGPEPSVPTTGETGVALEDASGVVETEGGNAVLKE